MLSEIDVVPHRRSRCAGSTGSRGADCRADNAGTGNNDIWIGATAIRHGLTLLTNNRQHFERMQGLSIVSM